jgi:hypothetical protein
MPSAVPTVMVSSTFYDQRQIRTDLAEFLEKTMGYHALLSEMNSFPVDPDVDTIENCRRRVQKNADILILLIGGRYGYVDSASAKSITNLEYLTAKAKGLPIYAFIEKRMLPLLQVWKRNPTADFSEQVDDTRVFSFIEDIRSVDRVWMSEFDCAQDVIAAMRMRFAELTGEGLVWAQRVRKAEPGVALSELTGRSLALVLERPSGWEFQLFFQIVSDGIAARSHERMDYELKIAFGEAERMAEDTFHNWVTRKFSELKALVRGVMALFGAPLEEAMGPPGKPGDADKILFIARRVVRGYEEALAWSNRVRRTSADDHWQGLIEELAEFANGVLIGVERWARDGQVLVNRPESSADGAEEPTLTLLLEISETQQQRFFDHLDELSQRYGFDT